MSARLKLLGVLAFGIGMTLSGCGGSGSSSKPVISVGLTPTMSQAIDQGQKIQFTAMVTNDSSAKGVTWSQSGQGGLSNQTSSAATYTAPTSGAAGAGSVTATSVADSTKSTSVNIMITPAPAITTTSLLNPMVGESYNQTLQFTGGTLPVTWSLESGTLPTGLSLNASTGAITGIPTGTTGTANFTVKVTDSSTVGAMSATQTLSLTVTTATACGSGSESLLTGQYAMSLTGFDGSGPVAMLASFTADGIGNITAGVEDINSSGPSGVQTNVSVTTASSSYVIGSDHRGCLTLVAGGATRVFRFSVGLISLGVAANGRIIEFDATGTNTAGTISIQNPPDFSNAQVSGNYAFRVKSPLTAAAGGGFFAAVGVLNLNGSTATVTGAEDININGTVDPGNVGYPATPITITAGTYNIGPNGRGTLSFTPTPPGAPINLIVYVLDASHLVLMSSDAQSATNTLFSGFAGLQTGSPYDNSSLSAASVLFASGQTGTGAGSASRVEAGVFAPDGVGNFTFSGDQNSGGTTSTQMNAGTYSVAANGRVLVTNTGDTMPARLLYMVNPNQAFAMSTDNHVMTGDTEPQTGGPFTNGSLTGTYSFATIDPVVAGSALTAGVATYDGAGSVTETFDINESGSLSLGNAISQTYKVSPNGRVVTPASGTTQKLTYIIFPGKVVSFGYTSGDTNPSLVILKQ